MARVYYPNIQKPSQNKRESGPKEKKVKPGEGKPETTEEKEDAGE